MRYVPKIIPEGINTTNEHPLKELGVLLGGLLAVLVAMYLVVGWVADYYVSHMSLETEARVGTFFGSMISERAVDSSPTNQKLQILLDRLSSHVDDKGYDFQVRVACGPMVNALALPGGHILVFQGLLEKVKSENEMAMILGHEIGHFQHRDHLKGLGRGLVMAMALSALGESGKALSSVLNFTTGTLEMRFSQAQESAADITGAELLVKEYGHVGGMDHFFSRLQSESQESSEKPRPGKIRSWFMSHPHPEVRVIELEELEKERGWKRGTLEPLPDFQLAEACASRTKKEKQETDAASK